LRELHRILSKDEVLTAPEVLKVYSYDGQTNWALSLEVVLLRTRSRQRTEGGVTGYNGWDGLDPNNIMNPGKIWERS
jgi:hypothetical protein